MQYHGGTMLYLGQWLGRLRRMFSQPQGWPPDPCRKLQKASSSGDISWMPSTEKAWHCVTVQDSWSSPINRNWLETRKKKKKKSGKALSGLLQHGSERKNRFPCLLTPQRGRACSLDGVIVRVSPGVRPGRCLRCFANPSGGGVEWRGICTSLAAKTCFYSRLFKCRSWVFWVTFVSFVSRICPNCSCTQLFLVPNSFFVFCCWRRSVSGCKHCYTAAKDPRSQACFNWACFKDKDFQ